MIWLLVGVLLVAGAVAPVAGMWRPGRTAGPRARARSAHARLGNELAITTATGESREHAQERWTTAGGVLAQAHTRKQCLLAEQLCGEGLRSLSA